MVNRVKDAKYCQKVQQVIGVKKVYYSNWELFNVIDFTCMII